MILWFVVGLSVWILCVFFLLAIFKGGKMTHGYERKLYFRHMENTQNIEEPIREVEKGASLVLHS